MLRISIIAATLLASAAAPAAADPLSYAFGEGRPVYRAEAAPPLPAYRTQRAPVIIGPVPESRRVYRMEAARDVEAKLRRQGFTDVSPLARNGNFYHGNAVDPAGNVVALRISIFTGEIVGADILQRSRGTARAPSVRSVVPEIRRSAVAAPPAPQQLARPAPKPSVTPKPTVAEAPRPKPAAASGSGTAPASAYAPPPPPKPYTPPATPAKKDQDPLVVY